MAVSGAVLFTVQGGDDVEPVPPAEGVATDFRGLEDLRDEAAGASSRSVDRTQETDDDEGTSDEPGQPQGTVVPDEPDEPDEPAEPDEPDEPASVDASGPEGSADGEGVDGPASSAGGFPPISGCDAVVPAEGAVANGELGSDHLCDVGDGHLLRPDAAAAFHAMAEAYAQDSGESLLSCVGNTYRSYEQQVHLFQQKPNLAARPGTSEHGWGLAIDFECGANSYSSSFYSWLRESGREFGWINPPWAQPGGSRPEPWHWEFDPGQVNS